MTTERVFETVRAGFKPERVLVVGDLMLDRYLWGEVTRISPEAPVPVVRLLRTTETAGGAANVALNLAGLGLDVAVAGLVGEDAEREELLSLLNMRGIETSLVVTTPGVPTTTKTRVMGGIQQMLRLDAEGASPGASFPSTDLCNLVLDRIRDVAPAVIILSDYGKGALDSALCQAVIECARSAGIDVLVDPKGRDYRRYAGATAITPNRDELSLAAGVGAHPVSDLLAAGHRMRADLGLSYLVVTRGEEGLTLLQHQEATHFPAVAHEVFDVSGAGDTVVATLAACLSQGFDLHEGLELANIAAGMVVGKVGTAPVSIQDLRRALMSDDVAAVATSTGERLPQSLLESA